MLKNRALLSGALTSVFVLGGSHRILAATSDACSLLTAGEVSAALEIKSLPARPPSPAAPRRASGQIPRIRASATGV